MTFTKHAASLLLLAASAVLTSICTDVSAQSRPTIVRDTDAASLAPFTYDGYTNGANSVNLPTVPVGKRLVIQQVSYFGSLFQSRLVFATVAVATRGTYRLGLGIPPALSIDSTNNSYYNYTTPATAYFEAGETPQVTFTTSGSSSLYLEVVVSGYYVTP